MDGWSISRSDAGLFTIDPADGPHCNRPEYETDCDGRIVLDDVRRAREDEVVVNPKVDASIGRSEKWPDETTRASRVEKYAETILNGEGFRDR